MDNDCNNINRNRKHQRNLFFKSQVGGDSKRNTSEILIRKAPLNTLNFFEYIYKNVQFTVHFYIYICKVNLTYKK